MERKLAVVIGASISGLMAARALSNHFAKVIVLERDSLADDEHPRKGVPQAHHVHVLLTSGLETLEHYFPGIVDEMVREGVDRMAWSEDMRWYQAGSWKTRIPCGISFYPQARVALEGRIRARLRKQPGVEIRSECSVQGLMYDESRQSVSGVRVMQDGQPGGIQADLVVDAAGRGSRVLKWLDELRYPAPPKEVMPIDLVYVSRLYRQTGAARNWKGLACHPSGGIPRGGILLPLDSERWILTLFGYLGEHPTADDEGILRFTKELPVPDLYNVISQAEPLSDPIKFEYPRQVRQRYDKLERFPNGLLVVGDAMCSLDPVFGQGMTIASQEARALDGALSVKTDNAEALRIAFFVACQHIIETPWLVTKSEALRFKNMPGEHPLFIRILQWYTGHVFALSAESVQVYRAFLDVMHLTHGPEALFRPAVLGRVLGRALSGKKAAGP
jgi:2-polyprenyl-6-methoxyphenol hydroxylase-like FAD-dependent oxidoreductase